MTINETKFSQIRRAQKDSHKKEDIHTDDHRSEKIFAKKKRFLQMIIIRRDSHR